MPTTTAKMQPTQQTRAIGWYALQRVRIADWLKPRRDKNKDHDSVPTDQSGLSTSKSEAKEQNMPDELKRLSSDSKDSKKLQAVVRESHIILAKAHSVFPFQLFPDSINIDRHKLTIIRRQFFGVEQKVSVPLENVKNIEADVGPFFGSLTITSDLFINNTQTIHFLWRDDTKKIQKMVQGAVVAQTEGVDLNKVEVKQLRNLLIDLGSGHSRSM